MDITSKKISSYEIEFTKQEAMPAPVVVKYKRSFIEQQIKDIQAQKAEYDLQRDKEITECQSILAEMDKLEITTEKIEVTPGEIK